MTTPWFGEKFADDQFRSAVFYFIINIPRKLRNKATLVLDMMVNTLENVYGDEFVEIDYVEDIRGNVNANRSYKK